MAKTNSTNTAINQNTIFEPLTGEVKNMNHVLKIFCKENLFWEYNARCNSTKTTQERDEEPQAKRTTTQMFGVVDGLSRWCILQREPTINLP